jgi:hypothetical protein
MRSALFGIGAATLISGLFVGATAAHAAVKPVHGTVKPVHGAVKPVHRLADPVLVVSPGHPHSWDVVTNHTVAGPYSAASANPASTASHRFREGPGQPPLGEGSLELATGSADNSRVAAMPLAIAGETLDSLSRVTYDTYLVSPGTHGNHPISFKLAVVSATLGRFTTLVFEPDKQTGHPAVVGAWQAWDALGGHWWATGVSECAPGHLCTWSELKHVIGGSSEMLPYFELGASGNAQADIDCALDAVVINNTTYDFELEQPRVPETDEETPGIPSEEGEVLPGQVLPGQEIEVPVTG